MIMVMKVADRYDDCLGTSAGMDYIGVLQLTFGDLGFNDVREVGVTQEHEHQDIADQFKQKSSIPSTRDDSSEFERSSSRAASSATIRWLQNKKECQDKKCRKHDNL